VSKCAVVVAGQSQVAHEDLIGNEHRLSCVVHFPGQS
jgi:hypothetical protein